MWRDQFENSVEQLAYLPMNVDHDNIKILYKFLFNNNTYLTEAQIQRLFGIEIS